MPLHLADYQTLSVPGIDSSAKRVVETWKVIEVLVSFINNLAEANGIADAQLIVSPQLASDYAIPNDIVVTHKGKLIAAIDITAIKQANFTSEFSAYAQRVTFTGHEFQRAYRDGQFGQNLRPFVGTILVCGRQLSQDGRRSIQRFHQRLLLERHCAAACPLLISAGGTLHDLGSEIPATGWTAFVAALASRFAVSAAMST